MKSIKCQICHDEQWVCEDHADKAWGWGDGCCGGAGMPCVCSPMYRESQNVNPKELSRENELV